MPRTKRDPDAPRPRAEIVGMTFADLSKDGVYLMAQPADADTFVLRRIEGDTAATASLTRAQARRLASMLSSFARG